MGEASRRSEERAAAERQHSRELALLAALVETLARCPGVPEGYSAIAAAARDLFPHDAGTLYVRHVASGRIEIAAHWSGDGLGGEVLEPACRCTAGEEGGCALGLFCAPQPAGEHAYSGDGALSLCVPLISRGNSFGVLHLRVTPPSPEASSSAEAVLEARRRLAAELAERSAVGLTAIQQGASTQDVSHRDQLTGLFNRCYLEQHLAQDLRRAGQGLPRRAAPYRPRPPLAPA